jgi:putative endonuclease
MTSFAASMSTKESWSRVSRNDTPIDKLVWFEIYDDALTAIAREKELKKWKRDWKIRLIEESNPQWTDLYPEIAAGHLG